MTAAQTKREKPAPIPGLGAIFITIFIDLLGFSLIFTLIPRLLEFYIPGVTAGTGSGGDFLVEFIRDLTRDSLLPWISGNLQGPREIERAVLTFIGGILTALYALTQFISAPFWGSVSDRWGRKKTLILTISLNAGGYLLWAFAGQFWLFVLSRFLNGLFAGNISVATAAVSDLTDEKTRTRGMGFIGMAFGFGFIIGPVAGSLAAQIDLSFLPGANPFSAVPLLAVLLSLFNIWQFSRRFEEPRQHKAPETGRRSPLIFMRLRHLEPAKDYFQGFPRALFIQLAFSILFAAFEFTLAFYFSWSLGYGTLALGGVFFFSSFIHAMVQGGVSRRLSGEVSEKKQILWGLSLFAPGFFLYGLSDGPHPQAWLAWLAVGLISFSVGLIIPALTAYASLHLSAERQGMGLGMFRSMGALARIIGPLGGATVYLVYGPGVLFFICFSMGLLLLPLLLRLPVKNPKIYTGGSPETTPGEV